MSALRPTTARLGHLSADDGEGLGGTGAGPIERTGVAARFLERLSERLADWRNRCVMDPAFRRRAARWLPTRPFARRQAKALFDLTAGFVYSQILSAAVRVDLFEILADGPLDLGEIARRTQLPPQGALRLLRGAAALGLLEARGGKPGSERFALGPLGAALVDNPGVAAMIRHHDILYRDLADPLSLLSARKEGELQHYWSYADANRSGAEPEAYSALMGASQAFVTAEILDAYRLSRHRRVLDVGGGDGSFLIAAGKAAPHLELVLFDLAPVAAIARARFAETGLGARASAVGGDFLTDALPRGADLVTLNRVLHDHDDAAALAILKAVRRAMAPGSTLLVAEPMAGTRGAEASGDAYFGFYLLAMGQGRPRRADELAAMLREAGFADIRPVATATPMIARILIARPGRHEPA